MILSIIMSMQKYVSRENEVKTKQGKACEQNA